MEQKYSDWYGMVHTIQTILSDMSTLFSSPTRWSMIWYCSLLLPTPTLYFYLPRYAMLPTFQIISWKLLPAYFRNFKSQPFLALLS